MDGLGQLFIAQNGSVYALVPAENREPPPRNIRAESDVTTLIAQILQRQQEQQHQQQQQQQRQQQQHDTQLRQQQLALQLNGLVPNSVLQREEALQSLVQASLIHSYPSQHQENTVSNAGPSTSAHLGTGGPPQMHRRRLPSVGTPSDSGRSDSQSPPPSTRGGERSERSNQNGLGVSTQMSAKEKNRQAQRRFRERQKDLIANLKQRVENLQSRVVESEKEVTALKEENAMLRGRIEGKQGSSVTLPAEALQSLLQMTGAGGLLAEARRLKGDGGGNVATPPVVTSTSNMAIQRMGRGGDTAVRVSEGNGRELETGRRNDFRIQHGAID